MSDKKNLKPINKQTETYNLPFTAEVDLRNRVTIPRAITKLTKLQYGDKVTLTLTGIYRNSKQPKEPKQ